MPVAMMKTIVTRSLNLKSLVMIAVPTIKEEVNEAIKMANESAVGAVKEEAVRIRGGEAVQRRVTPRKTRGMRRNQPIRMRSERLEETVRRSVVVDAVQAGMLKKMTTLALGRQNLRLMLITQRKREKSLVIKNQIDGVDDVGRGRTMMSNVDGTIL